MNIFYLDENPALAAQYHCDKHVVKMILETAQLLSSAHRVLDGEKGLLSDWRECFYKLTHKNHPSAIWARASASNYKWLAQLGLELCTEYTHRYNRVHATNNMLLDLEAYYPDNISRIPDFTPPPQCMPDEFKHIDTVIAYRNYYIGGKADICQWNHSEKPYWYNGNLLER